MLKAALSFMNRNAGANTSGGASNSKDGRIKTHTNCLLNLGIFKGRRKKIFDLIQVSTRNLRFEFLIASILYLHIYLGFKNGLLVHALVLVCNFGNYI